nr:MAG TPA: hypothetical protein [Caudoviricetes sp.]
MTFSTRCVRVLIKKFINTSSRRYVMKKEKLQALIQIIAGIMMKLIMTN